MPRNRFDASLLPLSPNLAFEADLWAQGKLYVAGVDEAGRGALAGPVAAGVVILPPYKEVQSLLWGVRDSKQMRPPERDQWAEVVRQVALAWQVGFASHQEIDRLGIVPATRLAIHRALLAMPVQPQHILVDFLSLPDEFFPQTALVKGDRRSLSIAAASLLAKTARDALMRQMDREYPGYGFAANKGYGSSLHRRALAERGPSPIHRLSYALLPPGGS